MAEPQTHPIDCASEAMIDLIAEALDHGFGSLENTGGTLTPFVILDFGGRQELTRMVVDDSEAALVQAAIHVSSGGPKLLRYVFVFDAFIRINGIRSDAIFIHASERAMPYAVVFYQSYARSVSGSAALERQGEVGFVGTADSLLV